MKCALINPADVDASGQDLLSDPRGLDRITPTRSRRIERLRQREGQRIESCCVPHETIVWLGKQGSGAIRPQPDADDCDAPCRAQIERTKQLTGKDDRCLPRPVPEWPCIPGRSSQLTVPFVSDSFKPTNAEHATLRSGSHQ